jgi:2-polyprenyl-3-methyl-5-hydroxy-6-metoxy-1,4-benzoquinol methylase
MSSRKDSKGTIDYVTPYHWEAIGVSREVQKRRLYFAAKYIKSGDFVLDIGCGDGFLTDALSTSCEKVVGMDTSVTGISLAKSRVDNAKVELAIGSARGLPFKSETFDVVTLFEVIEHISAEQVRRVIQEISRVLKQKGKIVVTTPNLHNLENRIFRKRMTSEKHEKEYGRAELLNLLDDFSQIELIGIYLPLPPFTLLCKSRYRFIWKMLFPLGELFPNLARFIAYCGMKK